MFNDPTAITKLLPVNNSDPAITTKLKAPPKAIPITILVAGEPADDNNPPIVNISIIAIPTKSPANIAETKYPTLLFFNNSFLALAAPATLLNSSLNIIIPPNSICYFNNNL